MNFFNRSVRVITGAVYRFYWDDCFSRAAALAYSTLFSLVPFIALSFSLFTAFKVDQNQLTYFLRTFLEQILPPIEGEQLRTFHDEVFTYVQTFTSNISAMNTLSIVLLVTSSIVLINTIESALNVIWRVPSKLKVLEKLINFWAIVTLGPLLIAVSIYYTTRFQALAGSHLSMQSKLFPIMSFAIPVVVSWMALALLYAKMPAAKVRIKDAIFGAGVAAVLFEFVKYAFAYYLTLSTAYSTIYGVLASVPLFLFWLYIAWVVVLLGAEIAYQSGAIQFHDTRRKYATDLGEIGALLGLRVLAIVGREFRAGRPTPTESEIVQQTGSDPELLRTVFDLLTDAKILTLADPETHSRTLLVAPEKLSLQQIFGAFLSLEEQQRRNGKGVRVPLAEDLVRIGIVVPECQSQNGDLSGCTLSQFLAAGAGNEPEKSEISMV